MWNEKWDVNLYCTHCLKEKRKKKTRMVMWTTSQCSMWKLQFAVVKAPHQVCQEEWPQLQPLAAQSWLGRNCRKPSGRRLEDMTSWTQADWILYSCWALDLVIVCIVGWDRCFFPTPLAFREEISLVSCLSSYRNMICCHEGVCVFVWVGGCVVVSTFLKAHACMSAMYRLYAFLSDPGGWW